MDSSARLGARRRWLIVAAAAVVAFVALLLIAPEGAPFLRCPFKMWTGLDCPGCGSQRALQALFHGHLSQAWGYNPMTLIGLPIVALYLALELWHSQQGAWALDSKQGVWAPDSQQGAWAPDSQQGAWAPDSQQGAWAPSPAISRLYRVLYSTPAIIAWLVIILGWWVFRNL